MISKFHLIGQISNHHRIFNYLIYSVGRKDVKGLLASEFVCRSTFGHGKFKKLYHADYYIFTVPFSDSICRFIPGRNIASQTWGEWCTEEVSVVSLYKVREE